VVGKKKAGVSVPFTGGGRGGEEGWATSKDLFEKGEGNRGGKAKLCRRKRRGKKGGLGKRTSVGGGGGAPVGKPGTTGGAQSRKLSDPGGTIKTAGRPRGKIGTKKKKSAVVGIGWWTFVLCERRARL